VNRGHCTAGHYWSFSLGHYFPEKETWLFFITHRNRHRELDKMRRQRTISQMKEQDKITKRELNNMEISNMLDREFKVKVIIPTTLEKRVEDISETLNKEKT